MNIFLYLDNNTWIHRLDPRTKMIGVLISFSICLCFNHPLYMAVISLGITWLPSLPKRCKTSGGSVHPHSPHHFQHGDVALFYKGPTPLWSLGSLQVSQESLLYGMAMGLRLATFVGIGLIFLSTTRNEELTNGLIEWDVPTHRLCPIYCFKACAYFRRCGSNHHSGSSIARIGSRVGKHLQPYGKFIPQAVLSSFTPSVTPICWQWPWNPKVQPESKRTLYYEPKMRGIDYMVSSSYFGPWIIIVCPTGITPRCDHPRPL